MYQSGSRFTFTYLSTLICPGSAFISDLPYSVQFSFINYIFKCPLWSHCHDVHNSNSISSNLWSRLPGYSRAKHRTLSVIIPWFMVACVTPRHVWSMCCPFYLLLFPLFVPYAGTVKYLFCVSSLTQSSSVLLSSSVCWNTYNLDSGSIFPLPSAVLIRMVPFMLGGSVRVCESA